VQPGGAPCSSLPLSLSAQLAAQQDRKTFRQYLGNMRAVFTNPAFLVLFLAIGGAVGFFNTISTQLAQMMCSRGYEETFAGLSGSLLLGTGFVGATVSGLIVEKFGMMEEIAKLLFGIAGIFGILIAEFLRLSDRKVWLALFCSAFGIFGFGMYPIALELSVEATYPIDESIGTAMIFMSGQIQAGVLVFLSQMLEQPLDSAAVGRQVCDTPDNPEDTTARDHTNFLLVIAGYIAAITIIFILCFRTRLNRTIANQQQEGEED
jgi:FLVCR family MFS transporter 7